MYTQGHSRILGVGVYRPQRLVKSHEIMEYIDSENRFGVPTDWLDSVMGIKERRVPPEEW